MGEIMSEKRFELAYEQGNWWAVRDGDITLWKEEVVYLLNSLSEENEQLRKTINEVLELLLEEVDLFSDKATEHDIIAYKEMNQFDNKDAYYMCTATKKAIEKLKRWNDE